MLAPDSWDVAKPTLHAAVAIVSLLTSVLKDGVEARVLGRPRHRAHVGGTPPRARDDGNGESVLSHG
jgi:hypothetical protein